MGLRRTTTRHSTAKDLHDNATPAGNAVAATVLARLVALTGLDDFREALARTLANGLTLMADSPMAAAQLLTALDFHLGPTDEVAVISPTGHPDLPRVLATIRGRYRPNQAVAFHDPASGEPPACTLVADKPVVNGDVTVYVCRDFACQAPLVGAAAVETAFGWGRGG